MRMAVECPACGTVTIEPQDAILFLDLRRAEARATYLCPSCGSPRLVQHVNDPAIPILHQVCVTVNLPGPDELQDSRRDHPHPMVADEVLDFALGLRHKRNLAGYAGVTADERTALAHA